MNTSSSTQFQVERLTSSVLRFRTSSLLLKTARAALLPVALCAATTFAQSPSMSFAPTASASTSTSATELPDDPSAHLSGVMADPAPPQMTPQAATKAGPVSPKYTITISAGFKAQPLTKHEQVILGVRDLYSPSTFVGEIASAAYAHVLNGEPNYGTDRGAFGQRLGASALRDVSEITFSEIILAPMLHEDARYYVEGPRYNIFHRTIYAVTRPIFTRTDSGKSTLNASVLIGYAGASALSYTYYPEINKNFKDTASTFGGALAGAAVGYFISEFTDDVLQALHIEKKR